MYSKNNYDQYITEAVFNNGKETVEPLLKDLTDIKNELMASIKEQEKEGGKKFDSVKFWKSKNLKKFEEDIEKVFGFRSVMVEPYFENYSNADKDFESHEINCTVYRADRFPVEGLVTDKGFYDKSRSIFMLLKPTLGLIKLLDPDELLAVFLHEFGHTIDPALVTIKYTEVNALAKYLTDRKKDMTDAEKKSVKKHKFGMFEVFLSMSVVSVILAWIAMVVVLIIEAMPSKSDKPKWATSIGNRMKQRVQMIRDHIKKEDEFNRVTNSEAFADNFARMYGYGPQLASSFRKMDVKTDEFIKSRIKREADRQACIISMVEHGVKDVHKTSLHRVHALMKEYKADLDDPNTPDVVKKQIKEDMEELDKVVKYYTNNFDDFRNNINKMLHEELSKKSGYDEIMKEIKNDKAKDKKTDDKKDDKKETKKDKVVTEAGFREVEKRWDADNDWNRGGSNRSRSSGFDIDKRVEYDPDKRLWEYDLDGKNDKKEDKFDIDKRIEYDPDKRLWEYDLDGKNDKKNDKKDNKKLEYDPDKRLWEYDESFDILDEPIDDEVVIESTLSYDEIINDPKISDVINENHVGGIIKELLYEEYEGVISESDEEAAMNFYKEWCYNKYGINVG